MSARSGFWGQCLLAMVLLATILTFSSLSAVAKIKTVYITPMSHLDIGFTATQAEVAESYKPNIDDVLFYAAAFEDFSWTIETFWQLEQWLQRTDDQDAILRLTELIRKGQIELGAAYGSMHTGFMAGESTSRMLYPALRFAAEYELPVTTAIQNDVPGYSQDLPSILAGAGIKYFLTGINTSLGFGGFDLPVSRNPFYWEGPDGRRVLTWVSKEGYMEAYSLSLEKIRSKVASLEEAGYPYDAVLLIGAADNRDSSAAVSNLLNVVRKWNERRLDEEPVLIMATPAEFFKHMEREYGAELAVYKGEWGGLWERNKTSAPVSTSRSRWVHENLPAVESLAALSSAIGEADYPSAEIDHLYQLSLTYDEHTGAGGAGWPGLLTKAQTDKSNATVVGWLKEAEQGARRLLTAALMDLTAEADKAKRAVTVFNPTVFNRTGVVSAVLPARLWKDLAAGKAVLVDPATRSQVEVAPALQAKLTGVQNPWNRILPPGESDGVLVRFKAENVPPFGWKQLELREAAGQPRDAARVTEVDATSKEIVEVENEFYLLAYDARSGQFVRFFDKKVERDFIQCQSVYPFASVVKASHEEEFTGALGEVVTPAVKRIAVFEDSLGKTLRLEFGKQDVVRRMEIFLPRGLKYVDWSLVLDQENMEYVPYADHSDGYFFALPFKLEANALCGEEATSKLEVYAEGPETFVDSEDYLPGANTRSLMVRRVIGLFKDSYGVLVSPRQTHAATLENIKYTGTDFASDPLLIFQLIKHFNEAGTRDLGPAPIEQEPGTGKLIEYEYRITSRQTGFDQLDASRFGKDFLVPMVAAAKPAVGPGVSGSSSMASMLSVEGPVELVTFFTGDTLPLAEKKQNAYAVRLKNLAGEETEAVLRLPWQPVQVMKVDRVGRALGTWVPASGGVVRISLGPEETATWLIDPGADGVE